MPAAIWTSSSTLLADPNSEPAIREIVSSISVPPRSLAPPLSITWVKLGVERTQVMLNGGANDLGGTLMEETISRMAGSEFGSAKSVEELAEIAAGIGRPARQRSTTYAPLAA